LAESVGDELHVLPIGDLRTHWRSKRCWCRPFIEDAETGKPIVVHHALDARELSEPDCDPKYQETKQ